MFIVHRKMLTILHIMFCSLQSHDDILKTVDDMCRDTRVIMSRAIVARLIMILSVSRDARDITATLESLGLRDIE